MALARTSETNEIKQHYFKGWSEDVGTTFKTLGTLTFDEITLPTANQALQISSSNSSDTSISVLVTGYNSSWTKLQEVISTDATNGRTAVTLTNSFFRINQMRIVSATANQGDLYLSKDGASLTNGVPDNQTDYIYSMRTDDVVGTILNGFAPPESATTGILIPNYVVFSLTNDVNTRSTIKFQMKKSNSSLWGTEFFFYIDERSNSQFEWRLDGVQDIPNNDNAYGYDFRIQVKKNSGSGTFNASSSLSVYTTS